MAQGSTPRLELVSSSPEHTERLGRGLGERVGPGAVLALAGDLGAGKTCLVRGLAAGLGAEDPVSSPTYTLAHEYAGRLILHHLDAWMSEREAAFLAAGGEDLLDAGGVCAIEWAGRVAEWLPEPRIELELAHLDPERRRLTAVRRQVAGLPDPAHEAAWAWLEAQARGESDFSGPSVNPAGPGPLDTP